LSLKVGIESLSKDAVQERFISAGKQRSVIEEMTLSTLIGVFGGGKKVKDSFHVARYSLSLYQAESYNQSDVQDKIWFALSRPRGWEAGFLFSRERLEK
jgi:hypothetical protein